MRDSRGNENMHKGKVQFGGPIKILKPESYSFPSNLLDNVHMKVTVIFRGGQNLFNREQYDPTPSYKGLKVCV